MTKMKRSLRAKMVFGALTILDLHEVVKSRGDYQERYSSYSIGGHWLPIQFCPQVFFLSSDLDWVCAESLE
jgi:hypothetical protein